MTEHTLARLLQLVAILVIIAGGGRLVAGSAMAHSGGEHASSLPGLLGHGAGLGLVGVALLTGAGYWLLNRKTAHRPLADRRVRIHATENEETECPDVATARAEATTSRELVAVRRLRPTRDLPPRNPPPAAP